MNVFVQREPPRPPCAPFPAPVCMSRSLQRSQFSTASPDIDEKAIRDPDPRKMCAEIARAKAEALVGRLDRPGLLITSDQVGIYACIFFVERLFPFSFLLSSVVSVYFPLLKCLGVSCDHGLYLAIIHVLTTTKLLLLLLSLLPVAEGSGGASLDAHV